MRGLVHAVLLCGSVYAAVGCALVYAARTANAEPVPVAGCDTDAQCAALPQCAHKPGCDGSPATEPYRLVGYGCAGGEITYPIYRDEEDEFPGPCERIEEL